MLRAIEKDILDYIAQRHRGSGLRKQIADASIASRQFTGVGVYANLALSHRESLPPIQPLEIPFSGPDIESPALDFGASSLLWCDDAGYITCIELVTPGDHYPETEFAHSITDDAST